MRYRPVRRKLEWGVLIQSIVDPRCGGLRVQPPAAVAYLIKDSPENLLLTYTAKSAINYTITPYSYKTVINYLHRCIINLIKCLKLH